MRKTADEVIDVNRPHSKAFEIFDRLLIILMYSVSIFIISQKSISYGQQSMIESVAVFILGFLYSLIFFRGSRPLFGDGMRRSEVRTLHSTPYLDRLTNIPTTSVLEGRLHEDRLMSRVLLLIHLDGLSTIKALMDDADEKIVLKRVAILLKRYCKRGETVFMLENQVFAIYLTNIVAQDYANNALNMKKYLQDSSARTTTSSDHISSEFIPLNPVISITQAGDIYESPKAFIERAFRGLEIARHNSLKLFIYSDEYKQEQMMYRLVFQGLAAAIRDQHIFTEYQPIYDSLGNIAKLEVLARWQHDTMGTVPPGLFVRVAESTHLIHVLGSYLLERAIREIGRYEFLEIALNVSPIELRRLEYAEEVLKVLRRYNFRADRLSLEVTESSEIYNDEMALNSLRTLLAYGIKIYIDDFGTGYSNFARFCSLPIVGVKLDQTLIRDIHKLPKAAVLTRAIIDAGIELGFEIVVEGVETEGEFLFFQDHPKVMLQGFYLSKPKSLQRIIDELAGFANIET